MERVVKMSHITLASLLESAVHAHSSMLRVSVRCKRLVSMHWSAQERPMRRSTMSSSQACRGIPSRQIRTW